MISEGRAGVDDVFSLQNGVFPCPFRSLRRCALRYAESALM